MAWVSRVYTRDIWKCSEAFHFMNDCVYDAYMIEVIRWNDDACIFKDYGHKLRVDLNLVSGYSLWMQKQITKRKRAYHDLAGMMSHCEANYLILTGILPKKSWKKLILETTVGQVLELSHLEQARYTTTIRIQLMPLENLKQIKSSEWIVRLYHDAELAEVLEDKHGRQLKGRYSYPNRGMKYPDEKFRVNEHLGAWLLRSLGCDVPQIA